jgi:sarcosine oxidase, subunit delta
MMQIKCPFCGVRDETEFNYGGEADVVRPDTTVDDAAWVDYLYFRSNRKGIHTERWRHTQGCRQWFNAVRNTSTHQFMAVFRIGEPLPLASQEGSG